MGIDDTRWKLQADRRKQRRFADGLEWVDDKRWRLQVDCDVQLGPQLDWRKRTGFADGLE